MAINIDVRSVASANVTLVAEPTFDNPAGRLYNFLITLKAGAAKPPSPNTNMTQLAAALNNPNGDRQLLFERLADVFALTAQIREAVLNVPSIPQEIIEFIPEIDAYLNNLVSTLANPGIQPPPETLLVALKMSSGILSRESPEVVPDEVELLGIRKEISTLIEDIVSGKFDPGLAEFLVQHLHAILEAIDRFRITGVAPIKGEIARLIGDVAIIGKPNDLIKGTEAERTLGAKVWSVVERLGILVDVFTNAGVLTTVVLPAIASGHGH